MFVALKIKAIAAAGTRAGLLDLGLIKKLLEVKARQVADVLPAELHRSERPLLQLSCQRRKRRRGPSGAES